MDHLWNRLIHLTVLLKRSNTENGASNNLRGMCTIAHFNTQLSITSVMFLIAMAHCLQAFHSTPSHVNDIVYFVRCCAASTHLKCSQRICLKINLTFFGALYSDSFYRFFVPFHSWPWTIFLFFCCSLSFRGKLFKRDTNFD